MLLYIGSAKDVLSLWDFNEETRNITFIKSYEVSSPSWLLATEKTLYCTNEIECHEGFVSSFSIDPITGLLTFLNKIASSGISPCHLAINEKKTHLYVSNYSTGSLSVINLHADGRLHSTVQSLIHSSTSTLIDSHIHQIILSHDDSILNVINLGNHIFYSYIIFSFSFSFSFIRFHFLLLGNDKIYQYSINPVTQEINSTDEYNSITLSKGAGPRHLAIHPILSLAFVVNELNSTLTVLGYNHPTHLLSNISESVSFIHLHFFHFISFCFIISIVCIHFIYFHSKY